jgi:integrase
MKGQVQRRGKNSWRIRFDLGRKADGTRDYQYVTVRGKRAEAEQKLAEMLAAVGKGEFVKPSKITVTDWINQRVDAWVSAGEIGGTTEEGYRRNVDSYIVPQLGTRTIQSLKPLDLDRWHTKLRAKGLSARTIGSAHRVLSKALREAVKFDVAVKNVASSPAGGQRAPKVARVEMEILTETEVTSVLDKLRARHERRGHRGRPHQLGHTLYPKVIIALFTGMRRGEILALRWRNVDLDAGIIRVREALEETRRHGVKFKETKTDAGRRDISLPNVVADALKEHRREQLEVRMQRGLGRLTADTLLFPALDGGPQSPNNLSGDWREFRTAVSAPGVGFHALRHTHASMLIAAGIDIVEISKRLGHASPEITLRVYGHMFRSDDSKSAAAINATLARLGKS